MAKKTTKKWTVIRHQTYEKSFLEKKHLAYVGRPIQLIWENATCDPDYDGGLGWTSADGTIHVVWYFKPYMEKMTEYEQRMFRQGIFVHEMLHQIFSDFFVLERTVMVSRKSEGPVYAQVLAEVSNLLEDPYIEHQSPRVIGGTLLKSLRFVIRSLYEQSHNIDTCPDAWTQFVNALVMFGDMGIVKGRFTFPEAAKAFYDCAEMFYDGMSEDSP